MQLHLPSQTAGQLAGVGAVQHAHQGRLAEIVVAVSQVSAAQAAASVGSPHRYPANVT
jgi:hypothetical protein